jgi:hypothetical protein
MPSSLFTNWARGRSQPQRIFGNASYSTAGQCFATCDPRIQEALKTQAVCLIRAFDGRKKKLSTEVRKRQCLAFVSMVKLQILDSACIVQMVQIDYADGHAQQDHFISMIATGFLQT